MEANTKTTSIDLTNPKHTQIVETQALELKSKNTLEQCLKMESTSQNSGLFEKVALKLAIALHRVDQIKKKAHLSVVFAVYKETNRVKTAKEHPNGEDFLVRKIHQLEWLFKKNPNISWNMVIVDDGCPDKSGQVISKRLELVEPSLAKKVQVLHLQAAIDSKYPQVTVKSTNDSRKGGSVAYGMHYASLNSRPENIESVRHVVIFTDADLSTHLGQSSLLMYPILEKSALGAIGSRREKSAVVVKKGSRNTRGKLFIYLWKRMLHLEDFTDTQCGFKAFRGDIIPKITEHMIESKFAFDIELLLRTTLIKEHSVPNIGVAWIDSEAETTTASLSPYLSMLQSIGLMYKTYLPKNDEGSEFADFVAGLTQSKFEKLLTQIPKEIAEADPLDFYKMNSVSVSMLSKGL